MTTATDVTIRILVAPCGCICAADTTADVPGFCRTTREAVGDLERGFRERPATLAEFRAAVVDCAHEPKWGVS